MLKCSSPPRIIENDKHISEAVAAALPVDCLIFESEVTLPVALLIACKGELVCMNLKLQEPRSSGTCCCVCRIRKTCFAAEYSMKAERAVWILVRQCSYTCFQLRELQRMIERRCLSQAVVAVWRGVPFNLHSLFPV